MIAVSPTAVAPLLTRSFFLACGKCLTRTTRLRRPGNLHLAARFCSIYRDVCDRESVTKFLNYLETDPQYLRGLVGRYDTTKLELVQYAFRRKDEFESELAQLDKMTSEGDKELEKLVQEERESFRNKIIQSKIDILKNIIPGESDHDDHDDGFQTVMRIFPGIGGDESKLFAEELLEMYMKYAEYKNFQYTLSDTKSENRNACLVFEGSLPYCFFKHESGVHRVQRVPATERQGRTHTSTCSVFVIKKSNCSDVVIKANEISVETLQSCGPGGQNVNKVETRVRLKHLPTGITVEAQESRYQHENKKIAMQKLKNILQEQKDEKQFAEIEKKKKEEIGTNDYADKIRTYHFSQNRVTDHRINYSMKNLVGFMSGGKDLDAMIVKVDEHVQRERLLRFVDNMLTSEEYKKFEKSQMTSRNT